MVDFKQDRDRQGFIMGDKAAKPAGKSKNVSLKGTKTPIKTQTKTVIPAAKRPTVSPPSLEINATPA